MNTARKIAMKRMAVMRFSRVAVAVAAALATPAPYRKVAAV
jgi:hypothetical protein